jgi:hypothetical protein
VVYVMYGMESLTKSMVEKNYLWRQKMVQLRMAQIVTVPRLDVYGFLRMIGGMELPYYLNWMISSQNVVGICW